jgi:hypothetical protein
MPDKKKRFFLSKRAMFAIAILTMMLSFFIALSAMIRTR